MLQEFGVHNDIRLRSCSGLYRSHLKRGSRSREFTVGNCLFRSVLLKSAKELGLIVAYGILYIYNLFRSLVMFQKKFLFSNGTLFGLLCYTRLQIHLATTYHAGAKYVSYITW